MQPEAPSKLCLTLETFGVKAQPILNGGFATKLFGGITNVSHGLCCLHNTKWSQKCQRLMLREENKETRYQQRGSGYAFQGRDRQRKAVTKMTAKALALGSSKPDLKHRKDNSVRTDLQRARLQVRNRAAQLTKSVFT